MQQISRFQTIYTQNKGKKEKMGTLFLHKLVRNLTQVLSLGAQNRDEMTPRHSMVYKCAKLHRPNEVINTWMMGQE